MLYFSLAEALAQIYINKIVKREKMHKNNLLFGNLIYAGKNILLNIFPSLDTSVCAASVRRFNKEAGDSPDTVVLCISADLPFAHKRFCEAEGLDDVIPLSVFRSPEFGRDYGVTFTSGPLVGLLSRAVVIIDKSGLVAYTEQVPEIGQEPDYDGALLALSQLTG